MIDHLDVLAFPWFCFDLSGHKIAFGHGSLLECAPAAFSQRAQEFYATIKRSGWSVCPLGFAVYCQQFEAGQRFQLIIPGLKVRGISTAKGKLEGVLTLYAERQYIEGHVAKVLENIERAQGLFDQITKQNFHEIRGFNAGIYQSAIELEALASDYKVARSLSMNIISLSQMLSSRIDMATFLSNPDGEGLHFDEIPVYKKVDKVVRCFFPHAAQKEVRLYLNGESYGNVYGPTIFELVPFLLLDNAIKYSPVKQTVTVDVLDRQSFVEISIHSIGPVLEAGEADKIFIAGYRGRNAINFTSDGSGIGLSVVKRLVEDGCGGTISVKQQEYGIVIGGRQFAETLFVITLPMS